MVSLTLRKLTPPLPVVGLTVFRTARMLRSQIVLWGVGPLGKPKAKTEGHAGCCTRKTAKQASEVPPAAHL